MSAQQIDLETLDRTFDMRPGIAGWAGQCNHKAVGMRFIITSMVMFLFAGALALLMRSQLAVPEADLLTPDAYNQIFTMHGTLMMFFFAVPILEGLMIYFVPLQLGARDMPMPRVGAFGYWLYLGGAILLIAGLAAGSGPDSGWYMYPPLTDAQFSPGLNQDIWLLGVTLTEISAIVAAVEIIVLVLRSRAPGMTLARMPLFAWASLATATMILVAFPPLVITSVLLEIERKLGTAFFDATRGGDPLLWQHLFWWFGHPEVYIQFLPALGILATVIPVATRRRMPMRWLVVASFLAIAIVSFGLWVHHMFTTGIPHLALQFFSAASFMIAIPTGIIVLAIISAFWTGRIDFSPPTLFAIGFLFIFVFGGITGVMVGTVAFNFQAHDTYFVVGHFHSVLFGGNVFPVFAALYHWFPKVSGRYVSRRAGQVSFALMFVGFSLTFVPQHVVGFLGMARRMWTFEEGLGWEGWNLASSIGSGVLGLGVLVSIVAFAVASRRGPAAPADPWGAPTLEWSTASPTPNENFAVMPVVDDAEPRWTPGSRPLPVESEPWYAELGSPPLDQRETIVSSIVHGHPVAVTTLPVHSLWPLWTTVAVMVALVGVLFDLWLVAGAGTLATLVMLVVWLWVPDQADKRRPPTTEWDGPDTAADLPRAAVSRTFRHVGTTDGRSTGWWGAALAVVVLAHLVGAGLVAAAYLRSGTSAWPPTGATFPGRWEMLIAAGLGILAAVLLGLAERRTRLGQGAAVLLLVLGGIAAAVGAGLRAWSTIFADLPVSEHAAWSIWWFLGAMDALLLATVALMAWVVAWHTGPRGVVRTGRHAELSVVRLWAIATAVALLAGVVVTSSLTNWWG